jgi:hypothetical protein
MGDDIHGDALTDLWKEMPNAITLTAKRATAATVNSKALTFFGIEFLGYVQAWSDESRPQSQPLYRHTRARLTNSIDFDAGLVTGMEFEVLNVHEAGIQIQLQDGEVTNIWMTSRELKSTRDKSYRLSAFEITLAYATTVHQAEGQSLDHVCIIFEDWGPPGWAYTAVTRAKTYANLRVIGCPTPRLLTPRC